MIRGETVTRIILGVIALLLAVIAWETWGLREAIDHAGPTFICTDRMIPCRVVIDGPVDLSADTIRRLNR